MWIPATPVSHGECSEIGLLSRDIKARVQKTITSLIADRRGVIDECYVDNAPWCMQVLSPVRATRAPSHDGT
jgi:hypothetical protein